MGQPVKISDPLIEDARETSEIAERSIAGQIEYWAQLGRAIEPLLDGGQALALRKAGQTLSLSECLAAVGSAEGGRWLEEYLKSRPYPHYEPAPGRKGLFVRIEANKRRTIGKFVGREFRPLK